jgi:bifunctional ADP-heptose synthase (sugar kinase/adenylyltransferase)
VVNTYGGRVVLVDIEPGHSTMSAVQRATGGVAGEP